MLARHTRIPGFNIEDHTKKRKREREMGNGGKEGGREIERKGGRERIRESVSSAHE